MEEAQRIHRVDRSVGAVIVSAVGDALGAGYEFAPRVEPGDVVMARGTLTGEPAGSWTDDTAMALAILEAAAELGTLTTEEAATYVSRRFLDWFNTSPPDVGIQTREILARAHSGLSLRQAAAAFQVREPERAGNGSLMRTGPVALSHLGDTESLVAAATAMSALTHANEFAVDACVLWTLAIDHSIRTGELIGPAVGLPQINEVRREQWRRWIESAENQSPRDFTPNGYVVSALQAAWSAIFATRESSHHLVDGLRTAISIGDDTDTVAAIAGSLLGATYGVSAVPLAWRESLAGWPREYRSVDLVELAVRAALNSEEYAVAASEVSTFTDHFV